MFTCKRCEVESRDGVTCSVCQAQFDFPCAGITECGWRRLGDRKLTWKCQTCKSTPVASPQTTLLKIPANKSNSAASPQTPPADNENILAELKRLSTQMESLPALIESVNSMHKELAELKTLRADVSEVKSSVESFSHQLSVLTNKVSGLEDEIETMKNAREEIASLQDRVKKLEMQQTENEQRSRMNNIEIKGVPMSSNENLFAILDKIGETIGLTIPKEQINYIARVPTRGDKQAKNIICSVHNSYLKNDFVAAARKNKKLNAGNLGLQSVNRIYINDHLTPENKILLNKTKVLAKERGFEYVWVSGCKILMRKNNSSPRHHIKTDHDLKKFFC
ncbi:uncharacterized protein LOC113505007 [Trichoplusia ni]|uniref:Uncharacterized protein LOC113505007 n=1 Tax=Trichoplusia ni TaxID=7111 RepID=A0A7E5WRB8_TRINI|nr:uncharacterized protein LOC113505007 [Trichoplusia ni]